VDGRCVDGFMAPVFHRPECWRASLDLPGSVNAQARLAGFPAGFVRADRMQT